MAKLSLVHVVCINIIINEVYNFILYRPFQITSVCSECLDNQLQMSFNGTENQCCDTCNPGYGVTVNCSTTNVQTVCEACIPGKTYSSPTNSLSSCKGCSTCGNSSHFVLHPCNVTHNTFCECPKGSYYDPVADECKFCDLCRPGWGASRMCTSKQNTNCSQCVTNVTFSSKVDPFTGCSPCTVCSATEVTLQACSVTEDTICFSKYRSLCSVTPRLFGECLVRIYMLNVTHFKKNLIDLSD